MAKRKMSTSNTSSPMKSTSGACSTGGCPKQCAMTGGIVLLVIGILYLLQDIGTISWWTYSWWTVLFILLGLKKLTCGMNCR